jgi:hypothetical protein
MSGAVWNCPTCAAANGPRVLVCEMCGYERPGAPEASAPKTLPPAYREFPGKTWTREAPDETTIAAINALYARWGSRRKFGEPFAASPAVPATTTTPAHEARKAAPLATVGRL